MRSFANLFLILFVADGGFSLVDELVPLLFPLAPFTGLRLFLAGAVIVMAVPLYFCLGIDRRLPKRVFLPLIAFTLFCPLLTWLFPALADVRAFGLLAAVVQVLIGMLPLRCFRNGGQRSLTMPPELFAAPFFSLRNTLLFGAASLAVVPPVLAMYLFSSTDAYMDVHTAGFMRLEPGGLQMTERVYRRDNRTIRLAAMIHVGNREYYDELSDSIASGRIVVLAEGVSDAGKLLRNRIDYGRVAGFLGLVSQQEMRFSGRLIEEDEFESPRPDPVDEVPGKTVPQPDILRADVDVSAFRPQTLLFLDAVGRHLGESPSFIKGVVALNSWGEKNITPEMHAVIMDDILHRRNMAVLRHLDQALERYDTVVIPWGALHMKEIEAEVVKRGFMLQEERQRVGIDFLRLLKERSKSLQGRSSTPSAGI